MLRRSTPTRSLERLEADAPRLPHALEKPTLPAYPHERTVMLLVGLTGNIGGGKSTVAQLLSERGATIIDADVLARRAVELGSEAFRGIVARWGTSVLGADGSLDRAALRRIVFTDPDELEQLNALVHPEVERMRAALVDQARLRGDRLVVCDIPLLFERRMTDDFDRIVLVDAPRPVRLERLVRERGLRETEAMDMIVAQMPAVAGTRALTTSSTTMVRSPCWTSASRTSGLPCGRKQRPRPTRNGSRCPPRSSSLDTALRRGIGRAVTSRLASPGAHCVRYPAGSAVYR